MKRIGVLLLLCLFLAGCAGKTEASKTVFAMDTVMQLQAWGSGAEDALDGVEELLYSLEKQWSATDMDSTLGKLHRGLRIGLRPEELQLLDKVRQLSERTKGAFDPMLYDVMKVWGFYEDNFRVPSRQELQQARQRVRQLRFRP